MQNLLNQPHAGLALLLALALTGASARASGPGLGNLTYSAAEYLQPIATIQSDQGHGLVAMLDGYLFVPYSNDGNGGNGGFEVYNISDPRSPLFVSGTFNADTEPLIEAHSFGFHVTDTATHLAYPTRDGISIWDVSDVQQPLLVSSLALPGLGSSGYDGVPWSLSWQAPILFVGATNQGLYVVDTSDLSAPVQIGHVAAAQMGGFRVGMVYALGNLLVATGVDTQGVATLDISNPAAPQLLAVRSDIPSSYASSYFGGRIYSASNSGNVERVEASVPSALTLLSGWTAGLGPGGYLAHQDDSLFGGFSTGIAKFDTLSETLLGTASSGISGRDEDFVTPLGNLVFAGSDHHGGSALIVHDIGPDTRGPEPVEFQPPDGATDQPLTTRVGVRFSDEIDLASLDATSFVVRESGTALPLPGDFSSQNGSVHFAPAAPLDPGTSYDVVVVTGGLRDWAGNAVATGVTTSFSTGSGTPAPALALHAFSGPTEVGESASFLALPAVVIPGSTYSFDFGDGSPATPFSTDLSADHTYPSAGNYGVTLSALIDGQPVGASLIHVVHHPLVANPPTTASNVALLEAWNAVAIANTDNDSVTLVDRTSLGVQAEISVGRAPTSLALSPAGELWVVCQDDARIDVIDLASRSIVAEHALPRASRPFGLVFDAALGFAYLSLSATGELARVTAEGNLDALLAVGPSPRGIALRDDGRELWVSRFLSADGGGEVIEIDADAFALVAPVTLGIDTGPDTEASGRGLPNYLGALAVSPDETIGVVPAKKDNIERGGFRDGQSLTFESSVRAMLGWIEFDPAAENTALRVDFNDSALPSVATFSERGNLVYVAMQGSRRLSVVDAYSGQVRLTSALSGLGANGLLLDAPNGRLFVNNALSRSLDVYYVGELETLKTLAAPFVASVPLISREKLSVDVLRGKLLFNDAADPRLARDAYLSCNACHFEGDSDARVWDFTSRGQGFRRTPSLLGREGTALGNVHWTANFDEIQDFEIDVRAAFAGTGLMSESDFLATAAPLGPPKAGLSSDLDALASYVESFDEARPSPHRLPDGSYTAAGERGRLLFFGDAECAACHAGPRYSDGQRHDVGTVQAHSGSNGAENLMGIGFKTPALIGLWERRVLLHDGSAPTPAALFANAAHGAASGLSAADQADLSAFLGEVEGPPGAVSHVVPTRYAAARAGVGVGDYLYVDRDDSIDVLPPTLAGLTLVRTAMDDRFGTAANAVQFYLPRPARVVVAYAAGATQLPAWLETWLPIAGAKLVYGGGSELQLYEKIFPAGNVMLGGNQPAVGADAMYTVFVEAIHPLQHLAPAQYATAEVTHQQLLYVDRSYVIESAPPDALGMTLIRTANSDKGSSDPALIQFDLATPARVLVAFDDRASSVPTWLDDWTLRPGEFLHYAGGNRLRLYERTFDPSTVTLGGNQPAAGASSMYVVLLDPLEPPALALEVPLLGSLARALGAIALLVGGGWRLRRRGYSSSESM